MEGENVIKSLDSLWFFSNVMHSPKLQPIELHSTNEDPKVENDEKIKTPSEPIVIQEPQKAMSSVEVFKCRKNGGSRSKDVKENSEERKIRKTSKKRDKKSVNVGGDYENELGFDFRFDLSEIWMMIEGYEKFTNQNHGKMMPPLSDGMAMKQHLKSWAYAVACNVR